MKYLIITTAVAAFALSACGQARKSETVTNAAGSGNEAKPDRAYSGTGKVTTIAGDQVTIEHGPVEGIGWPAMTMTFTAAATVAAGIQPGDDVDFSFRQDGSAYVLTSLRKR